MELKRYTATDVAATRFYQMPKFLFEGKLKELSNDARVLYALIKDRHELSLKNHWVNNNGEVFLIFTREEMQETLGLSENTVIKAVKNLREHGLIEEERQGLGKPNKIYLLYAAIHHDFSRTVNYAGQEQQFPQLSTAESEYQEQENLRPNDNYITKTNFIDTDSQSINPPTDNEIVTSDGLTNDELLDVVEDELSANQGIPYSYTSDERKMQAAIRLLTDWYDLSPEHFESNFEYDIYILITDCLTEMACANDIRTYKGSAVSYAKVIDKINEIVERDKSLFSVVQEVIDNYIRVASGEEIRDIRKYIMSVIWNCFSTYRVKFESNFARTYGGRYA